MRKAFTLLELIVVIIIIGILATLGLTQYTKVVEKGRVAEAISILGTIRTAETGYYLEKGAYGTLANIGLNALPAACAASGESLKYYFSYSISAGIALATRCATGVGKTPGYSGTAYTVTIDFAAGTLVGGP